MQFFFFFSFFEFNKNAKYNLPTEEKTSANHRLVLLPGQVHQSTGSTVQTLNSAAEWLASAGWSISPQLTVSHLKSHINRKNAAQGTFMFETGLPLCYDAADVLWL